MTETQRRIKAYQKALPELRERVIAVALLLAMSVSMLSTASFAWLTISRNPEVTNVSTNVAANGNLEIALATSDMPPGASQVGDSSATVGKTDAVVTSNVTWGNLINLSDPAYGLERMVMRPAKLNEDALLTSPLWGAAYSTDGRITELDSKFGYTIYEIDEYSEGGGRFVNVPDGEYGVRAISSMKMDSSSEEAQVYDAVEKVRGLNVNAADEYVALGNDTAKISSLATMMGLFMTARMASADDTTRSNPEVKNSDLENLYGLYAGFKKAMELEADAIAAQINLVLAQNSQGAYTPVSRNDVLHNNDLASFLSNNQITITGLGNTTDDATTSDTKPAGTFRGDYNIIVEDAKVLEELKNTGANQKWSDCGLERIVSRLVNVNQCVVDNQAGKRLAVSQIGVSAALEYLGKDCLAEINNGILYRFEQRTGAALRISDMKITVSIKRELAGIPIQREESIEATIYTTAATDLAQHKDYQNIRDWPYGRYIFGRDMKANTGSLQISGTMTAQDTYGMAIDLWVRTNAAGSYLTLEGNAITQSHLERALGTDAAGKAVDLWTLTRTEGEESYDIDLYQEETTDENGENVIRWRSADNHAVITLATDESGNVTEKPLEKWDTIITVTGYEGENRVWNSDTSYGSMLSTDATTQGSGSCYVYYADTPEDQERSLRLLNSFKVAFIDKDGNLLASAYMDTKRAYAATGRVTVPLVLDPITSDNLGSDEYGNITYGIMPLVEDAATRITALVYLDGTDLSNENVLAASDIQGQLNIQFGSSSPVDPIQNEDLMMDEVHLNAEVDVTDIKWEDDNKTVTVTLNVEGVNPSRVTGFFMRKINATQGSREEEMIFTKVEDNSSDNNFQSTWEGTYTFTAPGDYILRTVRLDGMDYDIGQEIPMVDASGNPVLDENGNQKVEVKYPQSTVSGFTVLGVTQSNASSVGKHIEVFSTNRSTAVNVSLKFGTSNQNLMPRTVQARYVRDEDQTVVSGDLVYSGGENWTGTVNFNRSGDYTLKYVVLDGNYTELSESLWQTLDLTLGVYVDVQTSSPTSFVYIPAEAETEDKHMEDNEKVLKMYVSVKDDTNEPLAYQQNVKLLYTSGASTMEAENMVWNGDRYEGEFIVTGPGSYKFTSLTIGKSTLTTARNAPTFTIMSMVPPAYEGGRALTSSYQYAPNGDAYVKVRLSNPGSATVRAIMTDMDNPSRTIVTNVQSVAGSGKLEDGQTPYTDFMLQYKDGNTNKLAWPEGNWKLTKLELGEVYVDDTMYPYTDESGNTVYYEMDVTDKVEMTVVTGVVVSFEEDKSQVFGKDENGNITDGFLEKTYEISDLSVKIVDFNGNPLDYVSDVKMEITYDNQSSGSYGGYTSNQLNNGIAGAYTTVTLTADRNEQGELTGTYSQSSTNNTIKFAGSYTTVFKFNVGTDGVTYSSKDKTPLANIPVFEVYTNAPTVKVTGTDPAKGTVKRVYTVKKPVSASQAIQGDFFSYSDYKATVYIHTPAQGGGYDQEAAEAYAPTVTLSLTGVPAGYSSATMSFATKNSDSVGSAFSFTNGTATTNVGKAVEGSRGWFGVDDYPECYPAGTMTQDKIAITYGDMTYQVTLSNTITIDQPQSPTAMIFAGIPESYTGTRPSQVIGQGTTVTTKLPEAMYWTATVEEPQGGTWSPYTFKETVDDVQGTDTRMLWYTQWDKEGSCGSKTTHYKYRIYHWSRFESSITAETDIYTQAYKITKWKINGVTYNAGDTVSVSGDGIITATAQYEYNGPKTFVETKEATTTKYLYGYAETGDQSDDTTTSPDVNIKQTAEHGTTQNATPVTPKLAIPSTANAATDTVGTNMSTDVAAYTKFQ